MENTDTSNNQKTRNCHFCGAVIHGRADKRYCNDYCRNASNQKMRKEEAVEMHYNAAEIFKVIKRNYEILKKDDPAIMNANEESFCQIDDFLKTGIDTRFFTSTYEDKNGTIWYCVFDRCYAMDNVYVSIKDFPEQAEL